MFLPPKRYFKAALNRVRLQTHWETNSGRPHRKQKCYQLNYHRQRKRNCFYDTYELKVQKMKNETVLKRRVDC
jgi:hypothetical protein